MDLVSKMTKEILLDSKLDPKGETFLWHDYCTFYKYPLKTGTQMTTFWPTKSSGILQLAPCWLLIRSATPNKYGDSKGKPRLREYRAGPLRCRKYSRQRVGSARTDPNDVRRTSENGTISLTRVATDSIPRCKLDGFQIHHYAESFMLHPYLILPGCLHAISGLDLTMLFHTPQ